MIIAASEFEWRHLINKKMNEFLISLSSQISDQIFNERKFVGKKEMMKEVFEWLTANVWKRQRSNEWSVLLMFVHSSFFSILFILTCLCFCFVLKLLSLLFYSIPRTNYSHQLSKRHKQSSNRIFFFFFFFFFFFLFLTRFHSYCLLIPHTIMTNSAEWKCSSSIDQ